MQEKHVEQALVRRVKQRGGYSPKLVSPGTVGMPDRLIIMPGNNTALIEVKAPGQEPRPIQTHRINQLKKIGTKVYILDTADPTAIDRLLDEIQTP